MESENEDPEKEYLRCEECGELIEYDPEKHVFTSEFGEHNIRGFEHFVVEHPELLG